MDPKQLEKKLSDIPVGPAVSDLRDGGYLADYSHLLSEKNRDDGYRLHVHHEGAQHSLKAEVTHLEYPVGFLQTFTDSSKGLKVDHAYLRSPHRGRGLGTNLYEAVYAHARNAMGIQRAFGGVHSTPAHNAHQKVAQKHGLSYRARQIADVGEASTPSPLGVAGRSAGDYDDAYNKYSYALKSEGANPVDSDAARSQAAFGPEHTPAFHAAAFLSGRTADLASVRRALVQADGDIRLAALIAHGLDVTPANLKALDAAQSLSKAEPPAPVTPPKSIVAAQHQGDDVAHAVQRAFQDNFVFEVLLSGKHSSGTLLARDERTGTAWMLKPGDSDPGPAAGVREETATQSAREAAFYHVAKLWGLYNYVPRAELLLLDGRQVAAMEFLGNKYKTLAKLDDSNPNAGRQILGPLLRNGTLHQLAFLDAVLGNADSHGNNAMVDGEGHLKLIDHGAAFAGVEFDPANDKNSFIPAYLRAWTPSSFSTLPTASKLQHLPRISAGVAEQLKTWASRLHAEELEHTLYAYGINPSATLRRFHQLKTAILDQPVDLAVNRFWTTV